MSISSDQKLAIDTILCVLETGHLPSAEAYGMVTVLSDGAGITYGKHQSTDRSNSLDDILWRYTDRKGEYAFALRPFLDELSNNATAKLNPKKLPPWVVQLMDLLHRAGADPIMQRAQDEIFDENYWEPAFRQGVAMGMKEALSYCVIYDSFIQGSFSTVRKKFSEVPPNRGGKERAWTQAYLNHRAEWLLNHKNKLVNNSVYRVEELMKLMNDGNWDLELPLEVRGLVIDHG